MNNTSIPESDKKLDDDLREILGKVVSLRDGLYARRAGCACDEQRLCAHHAAVYNHLSKARESLHRAMDQLESEG
jgi:hypothetical protein